MTYEDDNPTTVILGDIEDAIEHLRHALVVATRGDDELDENWPAWGEMTAKIEAALTLTAAMLPFHPELVAAAKREREHQEHMEGLADAASY